MAARSCALKDQVGPGGWKGRGWWGRLRQLVRRGTVARQSRGGGAAQDRGRVQWVQRVGGWIGAGRR